MGFVMPEIVVQNILAYGIKQLRSNEAAFRDIFTQYTDAQLSAVYGETYVDQLWNWFSTTKIPVVQAWSFNAQKIPCISVHLASETEAEDKAAFGDIGYMDEDGEVLTGAFTVMVDIGIHANKGGDYVLWLYYIISYILFKHKLLAHDMGLKLATFTASDYSKDNKYMAENMWTRWIRFRCTTQNFLAGQATIDIDEINTDPAIGLPTASSVSWSLDVDPEDIDLNSNVGMYASSKNDPEDEDKIPI